MQQRAQSPIPGLVSGDVTDESFRSLLGDQAWSRLPEAVRQRFSRHLAPGEVELYRGTVVATELSRLGRALSLLARVIGSPLPTANGAVGPAVVAVTEDPALNGRRWLRIYERPGRKPQMIQSTKRFRGTTGLEEYVGAGLSMQLQVSEQDGALVFRSCRYLFEMGPLRLLIPRMLSPGAMTIVHRQEDDGRFSFRLTLDHPRFGRLLYQLAYFHDVEPAASASAEFFRRSTKGGNPLIDIAV